MKQPWVLYLNDYQARVYRRPARDTLEEAARFTQDAQGQAEFDKFLARRDIAPVTVLVDMRQEEYLVDSIAHLWLKDRWDLLDLRLKRLFSGAPYTHAQLQGREGWSPDKPRRNDRVLFMSLGTPENLEPWLNLLLARKMPVRGVHSMPLLCEELLADLPATPYTLLLAHLPPINAYSLEGLRQSYFSRRQLGASRLLPLTVLEGREYAEFLVWEATKAQQYLSNLNLIPEDRPLRVILLGHPPQLQSLQEYGALQNSPDLDFQVWDIHHLAARLGLKHHPRPLYLSELVAYQVLRRAPRNHYARLAERRYFLGMQARRGIWLTALALALASGGYAAWLYRDGLAHQAEKEAVEVDLAALHRRNAEARERQRAQLGTDIDVLHIKNTVEVAGHLKARQYSPYPSFALLSQVLASFPQLALRELKWQTVPAAEMLPEVRAEIAAMSGEGMGKLAGQLQNLRKIQLAARQVEVLQIEGHLEKYDGNAFNAMQTVKNFAAALRKQAQVREVREIELPLVINPNETVRGDLGKTQAGGDKAEFTLEIVVDKNHAGTPGQTD